jgi:hypothetical protein
VELQRHLDELADIRLVVYDEDLGDSVAISHQVFGPISGAQVPVERTRAGRRDARFRASGAARYHGDRTPHSGRLPG